MNTLRITMSATRLPTTAAKVLTTRKRTGLRSAIVASLGSGRVAAGTALLAAPRLVNSRWIGPGAEAPGVSVLGRAIGIRDLALGAGLLHAAATDRPEEPWLAMGVACDGVDLAATGLATRRIGPRRAIPVMLIAGSAAAAGVAALLLDD